MDEAAPTPPGRSAPPRIVQHGPMWRRPWVEHPRGGRRAAGAVTVAGSDLFRAAANGRLQLDSDWVRNILRRKFVLV